MVAYYVGEEDEHLVDHPPLFACREHKRMLRLSGQFVTELIASSEDIMPGNPQEIVGSYLPAAEPAYKLPEFMLPPKVILYNPRGLRGAEALPYAIILIDKRFFGIPARYLSPDRFDGCDDCRNTRRRPKPRARGTGESRKARPRGRGPSGESGRRPPSSGVRRGASDSGVRRGPSDSGVRRGPSDSGVRRGPSDSDARRGPSDPGARRAGSGRRPPPSSGPHKQEPRPPRNKRK